jgi:hypothetical protein
VPKVGQGTCKKKIQIYFFQTWVRVFMCHQATLSIENSSEALVEKKGASETCKLWKKEGINNWQANWNFKLINGIFEQ